MNDSLLEGFPPRFRDLGLLGEGAMGQVRRVRDTDLGSDLAVKILRSELADRAAVRTRFLDEARLTASLRHPGIVAVHDLGQLADGRVWFAMQVVEGQTLQDIVARLHRASFGDAWGKTDDGWTLNRLLSVLVKVGEALGYAHRKGVVHRDIKPSNLMVGRFGEVLVMDWGVARAPGLDVAGTGEALLAAPSRHRTVMGKVVGTPSYMSPEQARGEVRSLGASADVYAMGAVLYKILTGRSPYRGDPRDVVEQVKQGPPIPVRERARLAVPEELEFLCELAMNRDADARPSNGHAWAAHLRAWLDQQARRDEALAMVRTSQQIQGRSEALRRHRLRLETQAERLRREIQPWEPDGSKRALWGLEDEIAALRREERQAEARLILLHRAAQAVAPDLAEPRDLLADIFRRRAEQAEAARRPVDAAEAQVQLAAVDTGRHAAWLSGKGWLSLVTDPPGAQVVARRFEERAGRMEAVRPVSLGTTPLQRVELDAGSWVLDVQAPGHELVRVPMVVARLEHAVHVRPGGDGPFVVRLPREGEVGSDACYVPGGWFRSGGDTMGEAFPPGRHWVDGFIVQRDPVTLGEWVACARDLWRQGLDWRPLRLPDRLGVIDGRPDLVPGVDPDLPVVGFLRQACTLYLTWLAQRDGQPWRLPHELEREKAGRGVDGRLLPWGNRRDPAFTNVAGHVPTPGELPVSRLAHDVSVYGVRGLAGNVGDLCSNAWRHEPPPEGQVVSLAAAGPYDRWMAQRGGTYATIAPRYDLVARYASSVASKRVSRHCGLRRCRSVG